MINMFEPSIVWLFTHDITINHFTHDQWNEFTTPVDDANEDFEGRFQYDSAIVLNNAGEEVVSSAICYMPSTIEVGPDDRITYLGKQYQIIAINKPRFESATPAYISVRLR